MKHRKKINPATIWPATFAVYNGVRTYVLSAFTNTVCVCILKSLLFDQKVSLSTIQDTLWPQDTNRHCKHDADDVKLLSRHMHYVLVPPDYRDGFFLGKHVGFLYWEYYSGCPYFLVSGHPNHYVD